MAGRDLHRGLVALDGEQALLDLHRITRLDEHLDHSDILEVADIGHAHLDAATGRCLRSTSASRIGRTSSCRSLACTRHHFAAAHGRLGIGGRRCRSTLPRIRAGCFQQQHHGTFAHLVAQVDLDFLHHASMAGRNFHGGLVALHRDQALLHLDGVASLDQYFNHCHIGKITDIRHLDLDRCHSLSPFAPDQAYSGLILSASMPYLAMASATLATGSLPSSASERSAASTM